MGNSFTGIPGVPFSDRKLFRSLGNGSFADVTTATGTSVPGLSLEAVFFDYDNDGWQDIVYANDRSSGAAPPAGVLRNQRNGTFVQVGPSINAASSVDAMGMSIGDVDNDGDFDIFMSNSVPTPVFMVWDQTQGKYQLPGGSYIQSALNWGALGRS